MDTIDCPKCEHEHEPIGSHEEDHGERQCDKCGFRFFVEIEYDPSYTTTCVEHEYGEWDWRKLRTGETVDCRFCKWCQKCELKPT